MRIFKDEVSERISSNACNSRLLSASKKFIQVSIESNYSHNFSWLDRPVIQYPQDMIAVQEIIWSVKLDLIIETGIAHGGSLILSASMLALLDYEDALKNGQVIDPAKPKRKVLGIDIEIRPHNRIAIESHCMASRIKMIEGSSIDSKIIDEVKNATVNYLKILVFLDSNHTHDHVFAELEAYGHLTSIGSYCVVFDTIIEDMSAGSFPDRPWDKGNNPKTAVWEYLKIHPEFEIDKHIDNKLLVSVAPDGYLKRIF